MDKDHLKSTNQSIYLNLYMDSLLYEELIRILVKENTLSVIF